MRLERQSDVDEETEQARRNLALVIDRSILDLLGIDEDTTLDISTDGRALVVVPVHDERRRQRFQNALAALPRIPALPRNWPQNAWTVFLSVIGAGQQ